jgi:hypothetical protein
MPLDCFSFDLLKLRALAEGARIASDRHWAGRS